MTARDGLNRNREGNWATPSDPYKKEEGKKLWGVALFGLIGIGATATIYSGQIGRLLRRVDRFCGFSQLINRTQSSSKEGASPSFKKHFEEEAWRKYEKEMKKMFGQLLQQSADLWVRCSSQQINRAQSSWTWTWSRPRTWSWKWESNSFGKASKEEAWRKHVRRMRDEYEEELERVERIRRMQSVFNRERNKNKKSYESWTESGPGAYHQHSQREDWYWKAGTSFRDQKTNHRETPRSNPNYKLSHHYAVLGLNRSPAEPYTEAEIKSAFRAKAMQFHPDQNQDDKEAAEAKFKEILISYEAIKSERKRT